MQSSFYDLYLLFHNFIIWKNRPPFPYLRAVLAGEGLFPQTPHAEDNMPQIF